MDSRTLNDINMQLAAENRQLRAESGSRGLKTGGGGGTSNGMDLVTYRLDQFEKRADAADARMARVEDKLTSIQVTLAGLATKEAIRNWGLALAAIVIATGVGVGAILLQSSGNQLAAFQSGLNAIQAIAEARQMRTLVLPSPNTGDSLESILPRATPAAPKVPSPAHP